MRQLYQAINDALSQHVRLLLHLPVPNRPIQISDQHRQHPPVLRLRTLLGEKQSLAVQRLVFGLAELVLRERAAVLLRQLLAAVLAVLLGGALVFTSFGLDWDAELEGADVVAGGAGAVAAVEVCVLCYVVVVGLVLCDGGLA
mgnify:CR=1 FL=1